MNVTNAPVPSLPHEWHGRRVGTSKRRGSGFTLLEVILALMIFSIGVVSLVTAINGMGKASIESRETRELESKVETTLLETTRLPPKEILAGAKDYEKSFRDGRIDTKVRIDTLNWQNQDGQPVPSLYMVKVTSSFVGQAGRETISGECVLYPPLYLSNARP